MERVGLKRKKVVFLVIPGFVIAGWRREGGIDATFVFPSCTGKCKGQKKGKERTIVDQVISL